MVRVFNVKDNATGNLIQLNFDAMTGEQLRNLENAIETYRMEKVEEDIKEATQAIYDFIANEIKKCPDLSTRTAFVTDDDDYVDWGDLLRLLG